MRWDGTLRSLVFEEMEFEKTVICECHVDEENLRRLCLALHGAYSDVQRQFTA